MAERSEVTGDHPAAAEPGPEIILIIIPDKILINSRQILQEFLIYCCWETMSAALMGIQWGQGTQDGTPLVFTVGTSYSHSTWSLWSAWYFSWSVFALLYVIT